MVVNGGEDIMRKSKSILIIILALTVILGSCFLIPTPTAIWISPTRDVCGPNEQISASVQIGEGGQVSSISWTCPKGGRIIGDSHNSAVTWEAPSQGNSIFSLHVDVLFSDGEVAADVKDLYVIEYEGVSNLEADVEDSCIEITWDFPITKIEDHLIAEEISQIRIDRFPHDKGIRTTEPDKTFFVSGKDSVLKDTDHIPGKIYTYQVSVEYGNDGNFQCKKELTVPAYHDLNLNGFSVNGFDFQNFKPNVLYYEITVPYSQKEFSFYPYHKSEDIHIYYRYYGEDVQMARGIWSKILPLSVGKNELNLTVINPINESESITYSLLIEREALDASLDTLYIRHEFEENVEITGNEIKVVVPFESKTIQLALNSNNTDNIMVNGILCDEDWTSIFPMKMNTKIFSLALFDDESNLVNTYTLTCVRNSKKPILEGLYYGTPDSFDPISGFSPYIKSYNISVDRHLDEIIIQPHAVYPEDSTITVNGMSIQSGTSSEPIKLDFGSNLIEIKVRLDAESSTTYNLHINREALHDKMELSSVCFPDLSMVPEFQPEITEYELKGLHYNDSQVLCSVTTVDESATINCEGHEFESNIIEELINLDPNTQGEGIISIAGVAENGSKKIYHFVYQQPLIEDIRFEQIVLQDSEGEHYFSDFSEPWKVIVPGLSDVKLRVEATGDAQMRLDGNDIETNSWIPLEYSDEQQQFEFSIIESTGKIYKSKTILIEKEPVILQLANLSIVNDSYQLASFSPSTFSYRLNVDSQLSSISLCPESIESSRTMIRIGGQLVSSGSESQKIALLEGNTTTICIEVSDNSDPTRTQQYHVEVYRPQRNNDSSLQSFSINGSSKLVNLQDGIYDYVLEEFPFYENKGDIHVTSSDEKAYIDLQVDNEDNDSINGYRDVEISSCSFDWGKENLITVNVTAENGSQSMYKFHIPVAKHPQIYIRSPESDDIFNCSSTKTIPVSWDIWYFDSLITDAKIYIAFDDEEMYLGEIDLLEKQYAIDLADPNVKEFIEDYYSYDSKFRIRISYYEYGYILGDYSEFFTIRQDRYALTARIHDPYLSEAITNENLKGKLYKKVGTKYEYYLENSSVVFNTITYKDLPSGSYRLHVFYNDELNTYGIQNSVEEYWGYSDLVIGYNDKETDFYRNLPTLCYNQSSIQVDGSRPHLILYYDSAQIAQENRYDVHFNLVIEDDQIESNSPLYKSIGHLYECRYDGVKAHDVTLASFLHDLDFYDHLYYSNEVYTEVTDFVGVGSIIVLTDVTGWKTLK